MVQLVTMLFYSQPIETKMNDADMAAGQFYKSAEALVDQKNDAFAIGELDFPPLVFLISGFAFKNSNFEREF